MKRNLKIAVITAVLLALIGALAGFSFLKLGLVPINADATPSSLEYAIAPMAVRASVARNAPRVTNPMQPTEENLMAGVEIYQNMCARCHGQSKGKNSAYGANFYPPVPQLPGHATQYTEPELFWIVKHGIRNTGMSAWGNQLADDDIWQVVTLIKHFDALPPTVEAQLASRKKTEN